MRFLDFDWSGEAGSTKYPSPLNEVLQWPQGARWDALITPEHDMWLAEQSFDVRFCTKMRL